MYTIYKCLSIKYKYMCIYGTVYESLRDERIQTSVYKTWNKKIKGIKC